MKRSIDEEIELSIVRDFSREINDLQPFSRGRLCMKRGRKIGFRCKQDPNKRNNPGKVYRDRAKVYLQLNGQDGGTK